MMRLFKKYISVHKPATIIYDETFYQILRETARHPIVLRMKLYPHHGTTFAIFTASMLLILTISGVRHLDLIMNLPPVPV